MEKVTGIGGCSSRRTILPNLGNGTEKILASLLRTMVPPCSIGEKRRSRSEQVRPFGPCFPRRQIILLLAKHPA